MQDPMRAVVVMGVSGCGKSSVASALADHIGARMIEADAYHPAQNVQKMRAGNPLTDADRQGWLEELAAELTRTVVAHEVAVLACSALKRRYRDLLRTAVPNLGFVFLDLSPAAATERVRHRASHFMPATLVQSQFRDLERPTDEPLVLTVDAGESLEVIVARAQAWWHATRTSGTPT